MTPEEKVALLKEAGVWDVIGFPNCIDKLIDLVAKHERNRHAWTQEHWTQYEHAIAAAAREAKPKKPEECSNGCPPLQVCDYCQTAERPQKQEPVGYWQGTFSQDGGAVLYEVPQASAFGYHYPNYPVYAAPQPDYKALWEQMCKRCDELDLELAKYTEPEPVAWGWATADGEIVDCICPAQHDITEGYYTIPLYTQPVRTKDLSDDEIADALYGKGCWRLGVHPDHLREYRRVIAADREKNK